MRLPPVYNTVLLGKAINSACSGKISVFLTSRVLSHFWVARLNMLAIRVFDTKLKINGPSSVFVSWVCSNSNVCYYLYKLCQKDLLYILEWIISKNFYMTITINGLCYILSVLEGDWNLDIASLLLLLLKLWYSNVVLKSEVQEFVIVLE